VNPRVSAICITDNRTAFLSRAIDCFLAQDYPNKELVVAFPDHDYATAHLIARISHTDIVALPIRQPITLGGKRNYAIRMSSGFYFCCWDDDDWYHSARIRKQVELLRTTRNPASVLGDVLLYNTITHEAYLSFKRPWEQTILGERKLVLDGMQYGDVDRGEDSRLIQALLDNNALTIHHNPMLYVYNFHGGNICSQAHWENNIFRHGKKLSPEANDLVLAMQQAGSSHTVSSRLQIFIDELIQ
jgi:glycosyltransferase involved in cell wall biosynthesis